MLKLDCVGRMVKNPEAKVSKSGTEFTTFSLAVRAAQRGSDSDTVFVECTLFGKIGQTAAKWGAKGKTVYVSGSPSVNVWTKKTGEPAASLHLMVNDFELVGSRSDDGARDTAPQAPARSAAPIPEGAVDVTEQFLNGDLPDLPF